MGLKMESYLSDSEKVNSLHHIPFTCDLSTTLTHLTKLTTPLIHVIYTVDSVNTKNTFYRSGTVNSKSFVGKVLLRIKRKFELTYAL